MPLHAQPSNDYRVHWSPHQAGLDIQVRSGYYHRGTKNKRELQGSQAILVQINIGSHTPKRYGIQLHHLEFTVIESGPHYLTSDALAFANTQPLQRLITNTLKTKRKA